MPKSKTKASDVEATTAGATKAVRARSKAVPVPVSAPSLEPKRTAVTSVTPPSQRKKAPTKAKRSTVETFENGSEAPLSVEAIAVRAYFIGEHRRGSGLSGDSESDWFEAERQLRQEAAQEGASL